LQLKACQNNTPEVGGQIAGCLWVVFDCLEEKLSSPVVGSQIAGCLIVVQIANMIKNYSSGIFSFFIAKGRGWILGI